MRPTSATASWRADSIRPRRTSRASDFLGGNKPGATRPAGGLKTLYWGREYKYDEVMDNFKKYFVKDIVPVLEEEGVFIAFHGPDDPPVFESLGGVARILSNYERIKAMFAAANSPNVGIQFCAGSWNEGGPLMGKDILEALREFCGAQEVPGDSLPQCLEPAGQRHAELP